MRIQSDQMDANMRNALSSLGMRTRLVYAVFGFHIIIYDGGTLRMRHDFSHEFER